MEPMQSTPRLTLLKHVQAVLPQEQFNDVLALFRANPNGLDDNLYAQVHRLLREHFLTRDRQIGSAGFDADFECLVRLYPDVPRQFIREQLELFQDLPDHLVVVQRVLLSNELKTENDYEAYVKPDCKRGSSEGIDEHQQPAKLRKVDNNTSDLEEVPLDWSAETVIWSADEPPAVDLTPIPEDEVVTEFVDSIISNTATDLAGAPEEIAPTENNNNMSSLDELLLRAKEIIDETVGGNEPRLTSEEDELNDSDEFELSFPGSSLAEDEDMWLTEEEVRFDLVGHLTEVTGLEKPQILASCAKHNLNLWTRPDAITYNSLMDSLLDPPVDPPVDSPGDPPNLLGMSDDKKPERKRRGRPRKTDVPVVDVTQQYVTPEVIAIGESDPTNLVQECKASIDLTTPPLNAGAIRRSARPLVQQRYDQKATVRIAPKSNNYMAVPNANRTCVTRSCNNNYRCDGGGGAAAVAAAAIPMDVPPIIPSPSLVFSNVNSSASIVNTINANTSSSSVIAASSNGNAQCSDVVIVGGGSVNTIDNRLVNRLCEIFPDAAPDYIRNISKGRAMENGAVDDLITVILDANGQYPKRPPRQPDPDISPADRFALLNEFLPDADPDYLRMLCDRHKDRPDHLKTVIAEAIELRNYPTIKEYQRRQQLSAQQKQYTVDFKVEEFLKVIPNPDEFFSDPNRTGVSKLGALDLSTHYALIDLRNRYERLPVRRIQMAFSTCNRKYLEACKQLDSINSDPCNWIKTRRKPTPLPDNITNIPLLQEIAYIEHREEIRAVLERRKLEELKEIEQAKTMRLMVTCQCCYDDEVLPKNAFECPNGCKFCRSCIIKSTEVLYGEGKVDFPCLNNCEATFGLQVLRAALTPKFFSKVAQKKTMAEVKAAGIEDLETCPFCDFATIPPEGDKIFSCMNPECMKQSCRLCKEPSHIPLRCDEIEKDDDVKARVFMENKMTEALLRKCYKCGIKFYKEEGCNKMTCSCGARMCYICNQPVTNYQHFNGQGGDRYDLCPLYSDTNQLHQENVLKGAREARAELGDKELKVDPTKDIADHYKRATAVQQDRRQALLAQIGRHRDGGGGGGAAAAALPLLRQMRADVHAVREENLRRMRGANVHAAEMQGYFIDFLGRMRWDEQLEAPAPRRHPEHHDHRDY